MHSFSFSFLEHPDILINLTTDENRTRGLLLELRIEPMKMYGIERSSWLDISPVRFHLITILQEIIVDKINRSSAIVY